MTAQPAADPAVRAGELYAADWRKTLPDSIAGKSATVDAFHDKLEAWALEDGTKAARHALTPLQNVYKDIKPQTIIGGEDTDAVRAWKTGAAAVLSRIAPLLYAPGEAP